MSITTIVGSHGGREFIFVYKRTFVINCHSLK